MNEYLTLTDLKTYKGPHQGTADDDLLAVLLTTASRMIDTFCNRSFYIRYETRYYDHPYNTGAISMAADAGFDLRTNFYGSGYLKMDDDLLAVDTLKTNQGNTTLASTTYYLMCGDSYNHMPYDRIVLNYSDSDAWWDFTSTPQRANHVTGWWGYNDDYPACWVDSGDTLQGDINASVTTLSVGNTDGIDKRGVAPRFKLLQTIKVNNEVMYVTERNDDDNELTVQRAINGTTAAAHTTGDTIYTFQPMTDIEQACRRLANWLYTQKDSQTDNDRPLITPAGITILPNRLPGDVAMLLNPYRSPFGARGVAGIR